MKVTVPVLQQTKRDGRKIAAALAADFRSLEIIDRSKVDIVLLADTAGVNIFGHRSPKETTTNEMLPLDAVNAYAADVKAGALGRGRDSQARG
jgi:ketopantoate hydroxymethyltransferase